MCCEYIQFIRMSFGYWTNWFALRLGLEIVFAPEERDLYRPQPLNRSAPLGAECAASIVSSLECPIGYWTNWFALRLGLEMVFAPEERDLYRPQPLNRSAPLGAECKRQDKEHLALGASLIWYAHVINISLL